MSPMYWRFRFGPLVWYRRAGRRRPYSSRRENVTGVVIFAAGVVFVVLLFAAY